MHSRLTFSSALTGAVLAALVGCKKEAPPPPPPPPPAPPPRAPDPVDIQSLLSEMDADARITFPQDVAPVDADLARSVVDFAGAFLSGDDSQVRSMLDLAGQSVLDRLLITGGWYDATDELEAVRVIELRESGGGQGGSVTYALQTPGAAYTLAWTVSPGPGGGLVFSGDAADTEERPRASDFADPNYQATGGSASSSTPSIPSAGDMSSALASIDPILIYMTVELNSKILEDLGLPDTDKNLVFAGISQSMGLPAAQAETMYNQGKTNFNSGAKLAAPYVSGLIMSMTIITESQNLSIDRERIIELYAQLSGQSVDEVRSMADSGAG